MNTCSKAAFVLLAVALSCGLLVAQDDPQDPPPPGVRQEFVMRGPMGPGGPGARGRAWGRMDGFDRDGRMGMRGGFGRGDRESGLLGALRDPDIRKQVGITDDQFAKIRQQESDFRKTEIRERADLQVKRIDLRDLLSADKPDRSAIDGKLQEISTAQLALEKSAVDHRLDMRDAITADQRTKLRQAMRDRWQQHRAGAGGPQAMGRRAQGQRQRGGNGPAPAPQNGNGQPAPPPNN
jgi:Spy/CpxP family protein refolding chaperone